ncbi:hypothetical protein, partial [Vibrio parahaemolyticus]|uniref:hypothetical protein n=1 Tax=Vibrio parahaemolyticus TaxID=670 RepID=UPI00301C4EEC
MNISSFLRLEGRKIEGLPGPPLVGLTWIKYEGGPQAAFAATRLSRRWRAPDTGGSGGIAD